MIESGLKFRSETVTKIFLSHVLTRNNRLPKININTNRNKLYKNISLYNLFTNVFMFVLIGYFISIISLFFEKFI